MEDNRYMEKYDVYKDIIERCDGDIYIGVVGPCRTGKSTFITKFMENVVLPNVQNKNARERIKDELPQSGSGKTITTTEPKFVPGQAVKLSIDKKIDMNVRLIDCVGYLVDGAIGKEENEVPRMVKTPWSNKEMPFEEAAEVGTKKVIQEHSNVGVLVTCDGSISDIERANYKDSEQRIVDELKSLGKPFVIILNSKSPDGEYAVNLNAALKEKYKVPVLNLNLAKMNQKDVSYVMENILMEFPLNKIEIGLPNWMQALPYENNMIKEIILEISEKSESLDKMSDYNELSKAFEGSKYLTLPTPMVEMGKGTVKIDYKAVDGLFYQVISKECNVDIKDDFELVSVLTDLLTAKSQYDKIKVALDEVKLCGYGVVTPSLEEMTLEEPEVVKHNGQYGVKLKASAPSMHIIRVDVDTEINPIVSTEQQGEELVKSLLSEFDSNPKGIWETNMFGKSLHLLVNDGLNNKLAIMPEEVKTKCEKQSEEL